MLAASATRRFAQLGRRSFVAPSSIRFYSAGGSFEHILVSKPTTGVRLIQLNRPKALNALFTPLMNEVNQALKTADADQEIGAVVITGSERSFAGMCLDNCGETLNWFC